MKEHLINDSCEWRYPSKSTSCFRVLSLNMYKELVIYRSVPQISKSLEHVKSHVLWYGSLGLWWFQRWDPSNFKMTNICDIPPRSLYNDITFHKNYLSFLLKHSKWLVCSYNLGIDRSRQANSVFFKAKIKQSHYVLLCISNLLMACQRLPSG